MTRFYTVKQCCRRVSAYSESSFKITQAEISTAMTQDILTISPGSRFRAAMMLAVVADALQIVVFPLFAGGALSPPHDIRPPRIRALLVHLPWRPSALLPPLRAQSVPRGHLHPCWA